MTVVIVLDKPKEKKKLDLEKLYYFVRLWTVEPYLFLFLFAYVAQVLPVGQLIQDKICRQKYHADKDYCLRLPAMTDEEDTLQVKSAILVDVTRFNMYAQIIVAVPSMLNCLFVGPFIDKYQKAKKYLILLSSLAITLETSLLVVNCYFFDLDYNLLLLNKILPALFSYPMIPLTAVWCYVAAVTPKHLRAVRMVIVELFLFAATPISTSLAGIILNKSPLFAGRELRNYSSVFLIGVVCSSLSFISVWWMMDEKTDRKLYEKYFPEEEEEEVNAEVQDGELGKVSKEQEGEEEEEVTRESTVDIENEKNVWKILFDVQNVRNIFVTFFKRRPHNIRFQLFLMLFSGLLYVFCYQGVFVFMYSYVQRVFNWNSQQFSMYMSYSFLCNVLTSLIFAPILLRVLKLSDLNLTLVSMVILFLQFLIRSLATEVWTFQVSLGFCALNLIGSIGIRTYTSKIVAPSELGSIYSVMSFLEQMSPLLTATVLSSIFAATIDSMPTAAFIVLTFLVFVDIVLVLIVSYQSKRTLQALKENPLK